MDSSELWPEVTLGEKIFFYDWCNSNFHATVREMNMNIFVVSKNMDYENIA